MVRSWLVHKQRLAMARVLLQKPRWVVLNRALAALEPEVARRLAQAFAQDLVGVGVVYIGPLPDGHGYFPRVVNLVVDPQGPRFKPSVKTEHADQSQAASVTAQ